jgi:NADH dehydrogenase
MQTANEHLYKTAAIFGGTGFIGRQVVRELAKQGYTVKVVTRAPERAYFLKPCGSVGQVVPFACDYSEDSVMNAVRGCGVVVNCIGLLAQRRRGDFVRAHADYPRRIARACAQAGVQRFVHISALGCDKATSRYARTKLAGEQDVHAEFPAATILRPSVVFGPEDSFFNMFAEMARYVPALPLIGGGRTRFQPVYVGDVADAVMAAVLRPPVGGLDPRGKTYELGGPEILTLRDVYERVFHYTRRRRALVSLPWGLAKMQAGFMGVLPHPPLTPDQVETLKTDNVVAAGALTLADLGIAATGMNLILPTYLTHYAPGGRFGDKKRA